jgi:hypothetical protein
MKSELHIGAIALVATLVAGVAFAQAPGGSSGSGPSGPTGGAPADTKSKSDQGVPPGTSPVPGTTTAPVSPSSPGTFMGRHTMTGEVTKIDSKRGMFSLKTKEGILDLHAPPSSLQGVKRGDQVAVEIAIKPMK